MSRRPAWSGGLIVASLLLAPTAVCAEIIRLKNGGMVRGTLTKQTATEVLVQTETGIITLASDAILSVEYEPDAETQPLQEGPEIGEQPVRQEAELTAGGPGPPEAPSQEAVQPSLADASQAVVLIGAFYEDGSAALGSGAVISNRGLIITNYHVVQGAKEIKVAVPDAEAKISLAQFPREYTARVLKVHECYDLALLRIPKKTPKYLRFAADQDITVGISVSAIGNPGGVLTVSVSKGVISSIRTMADIGYQGSWFPGCQHLSGRAFEKYSLIQTDAAINPGNSGGPLLNDRNEIVGINVSATLLAQGLNFAIHAKHARELAGIYLKE